MFKLFGDYDKATAMSSVAVCVALVLGLAYFAYDEWNLRGATWHFAAVISFMVLLVLLEIHSLWRTLSLIRALLPVKKAAVAETLDYSLRVGADQDDSLLTAFNDLMSAIEAENKALTHARDHYKALYDDNPTMVFNLSESGVISSVNRTAANQLGLMPEELQGTLIFNFVHPEDLQIMADLVEYCAISPLLAHKRDIRQVCHDGRIIWTRVTVGLVENELQQNSLLMVCEDITEAHKLSEKIAYQASHDALTELANRSEFDKKIKQAIKLAHQNNDEHVLCYLDLDQFKIVNDTSGHLAGDEILRQLGSLLKRHVRQHDFVARLGGDEFGILMYNCSLNDATLVCEKLCEIIRGSHFAWEGRAYTIGASIGITSINSSSGSAVNLLKEADASCFAAKDNGRNRVHVYRPDDQELALRQGEMQWVEKIQQGLKEQRFCLYGQPIVSLSYEEEGVHFETLIRYHGENGQLVLPSAFLPAAERYNLAPVLDRWVISHLFEWLYINPDFLSRMSLCSVNLSGLSLSDQSMLAFIAKQFAKWAVPTHKICFEITETAAISNFTYATKFINQLREHGCSISLDDFGSGLSSFAYLKNLPVDYLKIDGLFVKGIACDKVDYAMVKSINELGQIMNKKTVAEFVENQEIFDLLKKLGVDYAQGYGIGKPVPLDELKHIKTFGQVTRGTF